MARLKSRAESIVELKERDYKILIENTPKLEALNIAGIENMPIYKEMEHILNNQHIDILINPISTKYR